MEINKKEALALIKILVAYDVKQEGRCFDDEYAVPLGLVDRLTTFVLDGDGTNSDQDKEDWDDWERVEPEQASLSQKCSYRSASTLPTSSLSARAISAGMFGCGEEVKLSFSCYTGDVSVVVGNEKTLVKYQSPKLVKVGEELHLGETLCHGNVWHRFLVDVWPTTWADLFDATRTNKKNADGVKKLTKWLLHEQKKIDSLSAQDVQAETD